MTFLPFFNIKSPELKAMLGVEDVRSVRKQMAEIGVEIRGKGKNKYVLTQDVVNALEQQQYSGYEAKGKYRV